MWWLLNGNAACCYRLVFGAAVQLTVLRACTVIKRLDSSDITRKNNKINEFISAKLELPHENLVHKNTKAVITQFEKNGIKYCEKINYHVFAIKSWQRNWNSKMVVVKQSNTHSNVSGETIHNYKWMIQYYELGPRGPAGMLAKLDYLEFETEINEGYFYDDIKTGKINEVKNGQNNLNLCGEMVNQNLACEFGDAISVLQEFDHQTENYWKKVNNINNNNDINNIDNNNIDNNKNNNNNNIAVFKFEIPSPFGHIPVKVTFKFEDKGGKLKSAIFCCLGAFLSSIAFGIRDKKNNNTKNVVYVNNMYNNCTIDARKH